VAILGTEATIASCSYPAAIRALAPGIEVISKACPLFVPLVEEGRGCDDPIVKLTVETYLAPLRGRGVRVAVLGCTHYPLLRAAIAAVLGPDVHIVESGRETSLAVQRVLAEADSLCPAGRDGSMRCYVSDNPDRFRGIGSRFLDEQLEHVEFVPPEGYIASPLAQGGGR